MCGMCKTNKPVSQFPMAGEFAQTMTKPAPPKGDSKL